MAASGILRTAPFRYDLWSLLGPTNTVLGNSDEYRPTFTLRHAVDLIVCLFITVMCVRSFVVEGYMISTGSMAPSLLGYHKRVRCPHCAAEFKLGVEFDESVSSRESSAPVCRCPNCGEEKIDITLVPRTQGDQLLVHKNAFLFRQPDRWEVIVFRNPAKAMEAYVKRVIGRPGERVKIVNGDIFINGERIQKNLKQCLATELIVYDDPSRPKDQNWKSRWVTGRQWTREPDGFQSQASDSWSWVRYRHWLRGGGKHKTSVRVPEEQFAAARRKFQIGGEGFAFIAQDQIQFATDSSTISSRGVVADDLKKELLSASSDPTYRKCILSMAEKSHFAPIQDIYGYNASQRTKAVHDLGFRLTLSSQERAGEFVISLDAPTESIEVALNLGNGSISIFGKRSETILGRGSFRPSQLSDGIKIDVRQTDRRLFLTLADELVTTPIPLPEAKTRPLTDSPIAFAAKNATVNVTGVQVHRDIHYTEGAGRNAVAEEFQLDDEEYFVLGDNSPVSFDSRSWQEGAITRDHFIGKPVLVHLPSSPRALKIGDSNYLIRVPEFSKIRFVR